MATVVIMPRQGQSVESCIIAKWHKSKGEKVEAGDILFSYETDKASFDEEAKESGILLDIFFEEGDDVPCLTNVCAIGEEGESTEEFNPNSGHGVETKSEEKTPRVPSEETIIEKIQTDVTSVLGEGERLKISPRARNLAEKAGVDYRYASPSGPYGRMVEKDIIALMESGHVMTATARDAHMQSEAGQMPQGTGLGGRVRTTDLDVKAFVSEGSPNVQSTEPLYEEVNLTSIRKVIAKAMHHSITSTCQLTLNTSFDATDILAFRKKLKEGKDRLGLENITLNDIVVFAVSRILLSYRDLNAHFLDDKMRYFKNVNIGLAVDTERGLMVPTVYNANLKSLNDISKEVKKLAKDCQSGMINPDLLKGASFTVTNLGSLGIESFTPVLNPPQTGILGVNAIVQRAKEVDGEIEFYPAMGISLTFDHRALDGAPAARFLQDLKNNLENFSVMLAK